MLLDISEVPQLLWTTSVAVLYAPHNKEELTMKSLGLIFLALTIPVALMAQTEQNNPFVGTWKMNVAKSKFDPGPPMKSETVTIESDGKVTVEGVGGDGQAETWSYTARRNGKRSTDYRNTGFDRFEKISGNAVEHTWKLGKANYKGKGTLSKNGKVMTYTMDGTDEQGTHHHDVTVSRNNRGK